MSLYNGTNGLKGLAESGLIAEYAPLIVKSVANTLQLIGVWIEEHIMVADKFFHRRYLIHHIAGLATPCNMGTVVLLNGPLSECFYIPPSITARRI